jgi:hypothetical protein
MYRIDLLRIALYVFLAGLAWLGELRWWMPIAFLLYDLLRVVVLEYRTKAYREQEQKELEAYALAIASLREAAQQHTPERPEPKWN